MSRSRQWCTQIQPPPLRSPERRRVRGRPACALFQPQPSDRFVATAPSILPIIVVVGEIDHSAVELRRAPVRLSRASPLSSRAPAKSRAATAGSTPACGVLPRYPKAWRKSRRVRPSARESKRRTPPRGWRCVPVDSPGARPRLPSRLAIGTRDCQALELVSIWSAPGPAGQHRLAERAAANAPYLSPENPGRLGRPGDPRSSREPPAGREKWRDETKWADGPDAKICNANERKRA
jgi:hypothetical protein